MTKTERRKQALKARNDAMIQVEQNYIDAITAGTPHDKALKDYQDARHNTWITYKSVL